MNACTMSFNGALLERGFWLYVWRIANQDRNVLYVGRTGDSSSPHASSPFRRIGQHLDSKSNAKSNALWKRLRTAKLVPEACTFEMIAVGPLFSEEPDMDRHKIVRNRMAALERALADHLREAGHVVLGTHPRQAEYDEALCERVCRLVDERLATLERR